MARATFQQTNFLGGEWSPFYQGRADDPKYRSAMNVCLNGFPIEEGAWVRRPGSRLLAPTFKGRAAKLYPLFFTNTAPYQVEFTDGNIRFFNNSWPVFDDINAVAALSTDSPAQLTLMNPATWVDGDEIAFMFDPTIVPGSTAPTLRQRSFLVTPVAETYDDWSSSTTYGSGSLVKYTSVIASWSSSTTYAFGDKVKDGSVYYTSLVSSNTNHDPTTTAGAWASGTTYAVGDIVSDGGLYYVSLTSSNTGNDPTSTTAWAPTALTNQYWQTIAAPVSVNYISLQPNNLNEQPDTQTSFWAVVSGTATRKFTLKDAVTGDDLDGSIITFPVTLGVTVIRILRLATVYSAGTWANARIVQNEDIAMILNGVNFPQALTITPNSGTTQAATGNIKSAIFHDGPYFDAVANSQATVGGLEGTVEVTITFATWDSTKTYAIGDYVTAGAFAYRSLVDGNLNNNPASDDGTHWEAHDAGTAVTGSNNPVTGFQDTDVGRLIRLFSEPALWNGGNYVAGDIVEYNDVIYTAVLPSSNVQPDTDPLTWAVNPTGSIWTWGKITSVTNSNTVQVQILGDPLLYNLPVRTWRLGVYSDTTGYPTCGIFTQGRFWLGGAAPNRFDSTMALGFTKDGVFEFSPTLPDGTVTDANAISFTLDAEDKNPIFWFALDQRGIICGTGGGEWLITASTLGEAITPSTVTGTKVTKYRCADIEPRRTGISLVFVQKFKRRIMEFLTDVFTGRFVAPHLTEAAKHLTQQDIEEIYYQEELAPLIWARTGTNGLIGATYRRTSMMTQEAPKFVGWHRHTLGSGREIESISVGPSNNGALDALAMVTNNSALATPVRWVEQLTTMFDEGDILTDAWFLDSAVVPDMIYKDTVDSVNGVRLTGLYYLIGQTLTVFLCGLDVGDFLVDTNGTIFVPWGSGVAPSHFNYSVAGAGAYLFTEAFFDNVVANLPTPRNGGIVLTANTITLTTITTNPNGTSKVQQLIPTETPRTDSCAIDWSNLRFLLPTSDLSAIILMNLVDGVETLEAVVATITGTSGDGWGSGQGAIDSGGNLYFSTGATNYVPLIKVLDSDLSLVYRAGSASTFGPPGTPGVPFPNQYVIAEANAKWFVGLSTTNTILIANGADGSYVVGNANSEPGYMGLNQTPWQLDRSGGFMSAGAATHDGNVASVYIAQKNSDNTGVEFYFVGVADGVPAFGGNTENPGSTGKKGKGKKGAFPGGVLHIPTVDNPLTYFAVIGTLLASAIDPSWTGLDATTPVSGIVIDQLDNSAMVGVNMDTTGVSAWSSTTPYAVGDVVSKGGAVYVARTANTNIDPTVDAVGLFPAQGANWNQVPTAYWIGVNTGLYSRTNAGTFGLKWKVPLLHGSAIAGAGHQARVSGGLFGLISAKADGTDPIFYLIDTAIGKFFAGVVPGITLHLGTSFQAWDDLSQSFVCLGNFDSGVTGGPTPLNGTTSFTDKWMRLFIGNLTQSGEVLSTTDQPNGYTVVFSETGGDGAIPCVVGKTFTSQGQILRGIVPEETGARLGPALGKTRRSNKYVLLLANTLGIEVGTEFTTKGMIAPILADEDSGVKNNPLTLFSGVWRDQLEDRFSFDSMLAWQIKRPYPATVVSVAAWITTSDD